MSFVTAHHSVYSDFFEQFCEALCSLALLHFHPFFCTVQYDTFSTKEGLEKIVAFFLNIL